MKKLLLLIIMTLLSIGTLKADDRLMRANDVLLRSGLNIEQISKAGQSVMLGELTGGGFKKIELKDVNSFIGDKRLHDLQKDIESIEFKNNLKQLSNIKQIHLKDQTVLTPADVLGVVIKAD